MTLKLVALTCVALTLGAACDSDDGAAGTGSRELVIFAASSLTESFTDIASDLEDANEGLEVLLSFDSSSSLATQLIEGTRADVYASADPVQMGNVEDEGLVEESEVFATNRLVIVVPSDNPAGVTEPEDLAGQDVDVVLAAPEVPVGNYARTFFADIGIEDEVEENVVSNEQDVKDVLTKIRLGEADAGVVYRTDVTPEVADEVEVIDLPETDSTLATYPIAILADAPNPEDARLFFDLVLSDKGQEVLDGYGFGPP